MLRKRREEGEEWRFGGVKRVKTRERYDKGRRTKERDNEKEGGRGRSNDKKRGRVK